MRRIPLSSLATAAVAAAAAAQATPADGARCGLGRDFHAGRRQALCDQIGDGVLVLRGLPATRENLRFQQDKLFWYFTGVAAQDAALVVVTAGGERREILFLPRANRRLESWEGEMWDVGDDWVKEATGIADVRATDDLAEVLAEVLAGHQQVWTSLAPHITLAGSYDRAGPFDRRQQRDPFDGRVSREHRFGEVLAERYGVEVRDITGIVNTLRAVKTAPEIAAMRRAAEAGARAMVEAMRSTRPGLVEAELEAVMELVQRRDGAAGPAYQAIVGSGANSLVLHYTSNDRRMAAGDVVLIDFAPQVDHYVSDITRTWPVDGRFSARQAEIYDAVLAAQEAGIAAARPGNRIAQVEAACRQELQRRGFAHLTRHGACHLIGMEVHDPGFGRLRGRLVPGVAFTIEPGVYEPETGIGVRIEDVVVITDDGCEVLSRAAPKDRASIERLVAERGLLDPQGGR